MISRFSDFDNTVSILQCICKTCARVMVPDDERRPLLRRFRNPRTEVNARRALLKKVVDRCKRCKVCPFCGAAQGVVKKAGSMLKARPFLHPPLLRTCSQLPLPSGSSKFPAPGSVRVLLLSSPYQGGCGNL